MNINNFLEKVLVENELPIKEGWYHTANGYFFYAPSKKMWIVDANYIRPETIKYWYRPVTRESIEAFLREFGEKYYEVKYSAAMKGQLPDRPITELIKQYTEQ